jgi:hypothetical protein
VLKIITVALLVSLPSLAIPCINATLLRGDKATKRVKLAETLLEQGKHEQAAQTVDSRRYEFEDKALARRAEIIYMVGTLRGNSYRAEHAFNVLQDLLRATPDDPYLSARVAEALVWRADYRGSGLAGAKPLDEGGARRLHGDAFSMLLDLDKRDLMPDAMAHATLALLHHRNGDAAARDTSLQRCRKMTKRRAICKVR